MADAWFKFHTDDWLEATRELPLEHRGVLIDLIALEMKFEKPLRNDCKWIGHQLHIHWRTAKAVISALLEGGFLVSVGDDLLSSPRASKELQARLKQRSRKSEAALKREAKKAQECEKANKNNETKTTTVAEPSIFENRIEENKNINPPSPLPWDDVQEVFRVWNKAAEHWGLTKAEKLTSARAKRIEKRLKDFSVEEIKTALRNIGSDDFLSGKVNSDFRLTLDQVLQTDGKLGDVLARLLETNQAPTADLAQLGKFDADSWRSLLAEVKPAEGWPPAFGPAPGQPGCVVPREIIQEFGLPQH